MFFTDTLRQSVHKLTRLSGKLCFREEPAPYPAEEKQARQLYALLHREADDMAFPCILAETKEAANRAEALFPGSFSQLEERLSVLERGLKAYLDESGD